MCGACAGSTDWANGLIGGIYARSTLARILSHAHPRLTVRAVDAGWMIAAAGSLPQLKPNFDAVIDTLIEAGVSQIDGEKIPSHRELFFERRAVRAERRCDGIAATPCSPQRLLINVASAAVKAKSSGREQQIICQDTEGTWALRLW